MNNSTLLMTFTFKLACSLSAKHRLTHDCRAILMDRSLINRACHHCFFMGPFLTESTLNFGVKLGKALPVIYAFKIVAMFPHYYLLVPIVNAGITLV
jgi:hypothetical protein